MRFLFYCCFSSSRNRCVVIHFRLLSLLSRLDAFRTSSGDVSCPPHLHIPLIPPSPSLLEVLSKDRKSRTFPCPLAADKQPITRRPGSDVRELVCPRLRSSRARSREKSEDFFPLRGLSRLTAAKTLGCYYTVILQPPAGGGENMLNAN